MFNKKNISMMLPQEMLAKGLIPERGFLLDGKARSEKEKFDKFQVTFGKRNQGYLHLNTIENEEKQNASGYFFDEEYYKPTVVKNRDMLSDSKMLVSRITKKQLDISNVPFNTDNVFPEREKNVKMVVLGFKQFNNNKKVSVLQDDIVCGVEEEIEEELEEILKDINFITEEKKECDEEDNFDFEKEFNSLLFSCNEDKNLKQENEEDDFLSAFEEELNSVITEETPLIIKKDQDCPNGSSCTRSYCIFKHTKKHVKKIKQIKNSGEVCEKFLQKKCENGRHCAYKHKKMRKQ